MKPTDKQIMKIARETEPTNSNIIEAIRIRTAECFGAMNLANTFGGTETDEWYLIRHYTIEQLKGEAQKRGIAPIGEHNAIKDEIWTL